MKNKLTVLCLSLILIWTMGIGSAYAAGSGGTLSDSYTDIPVRNTISGDGNGVVLMYHHLVPDDVYATGIYNGNNAVIPVGQFEKEMAYLAENGYTTLTMSEINTYLRNGLPLPPKTVAITFDDGYESNYVYAYPILQQYNLKATIAVIVKSSLDGTAGSNGAYNPSGKTHLTFAQMREMIDSGLVEIGSHSYDGHAYITTETTANGKFFVQRKYLNDLGRSENYDEYFTRINDDLRLSKYILETELNTEICYFAFPYGNNSNDAIKALQYNGFEIATTVTAGKFTGNSNIYLLNRKNVNPGISVYQFADLLK
ncbi:MAG: polysaccharide deacetylase family protein [Bacillota bacterium]|jgi:peptidoglycan/xylan/chitin deacetylase (PgdA/CDA1 family)